MDVFIPKAFQELFKPARYKAYHGGRGSGKSHSFASALVIMGTQRPIRWLCAREIQRSLNASVKQLLEDKIDLHNLKHYYRISRDNIVGKNGTKFLFAGLRTNPDSIKSMEGLDGVWVEEAHSISQASLDLLTPTVRKPGSEIWFSWNRKTVSDPVDSLFLGGTPPPDSIIHKVNWSENPFFPDVLREEMLWLKERDKDKWRHVWEGEPLNRTDSKVFTNWTVDDLDDQLDENSIPRLGADWGFSVDPTVIVECHILGRTLYFNREAYKVKCEIDETPALFAGSDIKGRWTNVHNHPGLESVRKRHRIIADSARPETIAYMKKRGFNIAKAKKGAGSIEDGIEFLRTFDIVIHPRCKHIIDEFETYSYKIDPQTDEVLPILEDSSNHTIDAARYALEGVRRANRTRVSTNSPEMITH